MQPAMGQPVSHTIAADVPGCERSRLAVIRQVLAVIRQVTARQRRTATLGPLVSPDSTVRLSAVDENPITYHFGETAEEDQP